MAKKKEVDFSEIFKPNPHNIDPAKIKVGDMFWKSMDGVIFITEVIKPEDQKEDIFFKLEGKPLFKYKRLVSQDDREFTITERNFTDTMGYLSPFRDKDLINEIVNITCRYPLSKESDFVISPYGGCYISQKEEGGRNLTDKEATRLKELLNEFF